MFGSAVAAQLATTGRSPRALAAGGIALVPLGLALIVLAVWLPTPSLDLFLLGGVVSGAGGGLLFKGGVGTVAAIAEPEHRAEALAGPLPRRLHRPRRPGDRARHPHRRSCRRARAC